MYTRLGIWMLGVLFLALSTSVTNVQAASGGLSIGPFLQEVTLSPGQAESSFYITVANTTSAVLPLRLSVVDFGSADESGGVNFLPSADSLEHKYGLASWMRLEKDMLVLEPNSPQRVKVTVENKESLAPGGHYGAVVFRVDNNGQDSGDLQPKVSLTKAVSTLVLAKKLGGEKHSLSLNNYTWSGPPFALPREVELRYLNNGNVHMTPTGEVTITDPFNRVVSRGVINPESTVILPESFRTYPTKLMSAKTLWVPGWSTVSIRYKNNETNEYITVKTSFFIATPHSLVLLSVVLLIGAFLFRYRRRLMAHIRQLGHHKWSVAKKLARKTPRPSDKQSVAKKPSRLTREHKKSNKKTPS